MNVEIGTEAAQFWESIVRIFFAGVEELRDQCKVIYA